MDLTKIFSVDTDKAFVTKVVEGNEIFDHYWTEFWNKKKLKKTLLKIDT